MTTSGFSGAANAWVANFAFTPSTAGDLTADYSCEAIVSGTTAVSINYALSEVGKNIAITVLHNLALQPYPVL